MNIYRQLRMFYLALAALVFGGIAVWIMAPRERRDDPPAPPPVAPVSSAVAGSGLIEPKTEYLAVANPVAGVIDRVLVKPEDQVRAGDVLFVLETRHLEADLDLVRQKVLAAGAAAADAKMRKELLEGIGDPRAVRKEELATRRFEQQQKEAELGQALAEVRRLEIEIERQHVRAPSDGKILRVEARPGEFAPAGRIDPPLVVLGDTSVFHVRADIAEDLAWRVHPSAEATASPRGRGDLHLPLTFIRFEPYVRPKRSLTGNADERVDTRVVQAIYALPAQTEGIFAGQQVDVFIAENKTPTQP